MVNRVASGGRAGPVRDGRPPVRFARTSDGVRIAYSAEGEGPALVFVRGWVTHLELSWAQPAMRRFFVPLTSALRLVRLDNRANGLSDRDVPAVDLDGLVADIEAVVDALGLEGFHLWGSCFGGPPAIAYTARHPERVDRLVLDGTFANGDEVASPGARERFLSMLANADAQPEAVYAALSYLTDPEPWESHRARVQRTRSSIDARRVHELYSLAYRMDVTDLLGELRVPTMVLHRHRSRAIPFDLGRRLAAMIPEASFVALEGEAHNLWEEDAGAALAAIASFLGVELSGDALPGRQRPLAVLLTDIVDSTVLVERLGDSRARPLFEWHDRTVRDAIAASGGTEVKHTGDGVMASFESVGDALAAAVTIQRRVSGGPFDGGEAPLAVRIGLTAGEPVVGQHDLHGWVMHVLARVCAEAAPAQILVTGVVRELARGRAVAFRPVGERSLKGLEEPVALYEVDWRS
ncbi:MAG TPA: adenylate/guanylate cyclase domain-containing protein [Acidimicrobiales bacterium]|nr:adenylate/guanylate cyclase domain-containing protein [Acidimicrobiales bacterium]